MTYKEALDWLFSTQLFGIKLGLDGPRTLLKEFLAYPRHSVKVAHVAGTNGKGSTCAMIDSLARECGRRTGLFTSPHLIDFRERIQVSGQMIREERCAELLSEIRPICEAFETHPTFFEIALVIAMRHFRDCNCELIILETGMGGRLDATTAVPADVCAITPIGLDHTQWLGNTIAEIACEKAGIFLPGVPAFSSPQLPEAGAVLKKEANQIRAPFSFIDAPLNGYAIALPGEHQRWNAALAIASLHSLGVPISYESAVAGLRKVTWPGRFERLLSDGTKFVLDGAHNPQAAKVLKETWQSEVGKVQGTLIFGVVESKDVTGILSELSGLTSSVIFCKVNTPRGVSVADLLQSLPASFPTVPETASSLSSALVIARKHSGPVLIAGSLFLIGEARALLLEDNFQPSLQ